MLVAAFAQAELGSTRPDPPAALSLAKRFGLLPRIAARCDLERVAQGLGTEAASCLQRERALAEARELRHEEGLRLMSDGAAKVGVEPIALKGRALVLAGYAAAGSRPSVDLDLLVPRAAAAAFYRELRSKGFTDSGAHRYEHQLPALQHPCGAVVELHVHVPGLRLDGVHSATWEDFCREGLVVRDGVPGIAPLRVPTRSALVAHALVHALAQHGLSSHYAGWLLPGDLIDLGADRPELDLPRPWLRADLSAEEIGAARRLARRLAEGEDPLLVPTPGDRASSLLARHFVACALNDAYRAGLKLRWLESPLSEHGLLRARLVLLARAFRPAALRVEEGAPPARTHPFLAFLRRPLELLGKARQAFRTARKGGAAEP